MTQSPILINARFQETAPPFLAHAVVTDPPYNIGHDYGPVSDRLPVQAYTELIREMALWALKVSRPDAHLFVIHYPRFFFEHGRLFTDAGWEYRQQIRWCYPSNVGHSKRKFTTASREILWLTRGDPYIDPKADPEPYRNPTDKRIRSLIQNGNTGRAPYDWWEINLQKNVGQDHAGYANQIPRPLLRRIILCSTHPGDVVIDPFCGTGSTVRVANAVGRKGWGCDANPNLAAIWKHNTGR